MRSRLARRRTLISGPKARRGLLTVLYALLRFSERKGSRYLSYHEQRKPGHDGRLCGHLRKGSWFRVSSRMTVRKPSDGVTVGDGCFFRTVTYVSLLIAGFYAPAVTV